MFVNDTDMKKCTERHSKKSEDLGKSETYELKR